MVIIDALAEEYKDFDKRCSACAGDTREHNRAGLVFIERTLCMAMHEMST